MEVRVQLYAACRDLFRASEITARLEPGATAAALIDALVSREPAFRGFAAAIHVAVNDELTDRDQVLRDGDVVALLPPVSGG